MHLLIAWNTDDAPDPEAAESALQDCLTGRSWVRALPRVFIVKVANLNDAEGLVDAVKDTCMAWPGVRFIATPPMVGGNYHGWLKMTLWPHIQGRTQ